MIQAANNKVIVKVKQRYIGNISNILKISAIENNSSVDPIELVNIVGEVVSLPLGISNTRDYEGFSLEGLSVGDTVLFSFLVISEMIQRAEDKEPEHKNLIKYQDKEFWSADITQIFGIISKEGIKMINGYVMATPFSDSKIIVPAKLKKVRGTVHSQVMHIGNPKVNKACIGVEMGDTVYYNPMIAQKYQINNKPFVILQQQHILGKDLVN